MARAFSPKSLWSNHLGRCPRLVWGRAFGAEGRSDAAKMNKSQYNSHPPDRLSTNDLTASDLFSEFSFVDPVDADGLDPGGFASQQRYGV